MIDPRSFLANLTVEGTGIVVGDWRNVGAEGVAKGRATVAAGQVVLELKLYELGRGDIPVLEKTYRGTQAEARRFAHSWSNDIVKYFTGEDGFFNTQIAFADGQHGLIAGSSTPPGAAKNPREVPNMTVQLHTSNGGIAWVGDAAPLFGHSSRAGAP